MTHDEVRNKLRTQYYGKLCWQYDVGDRSEEYAPKNVLSCWAIQGEPIRGQIPARVIFLFEMRDHEDRESGCEILIPADYSNTVTGQWAALDKLVGRDVS